MEKMLRAVAYTDLFAESHAALDAIKTAAGLTDAQFAGLCLPVLRSYADHVQRLPLTISAFGSARGAWDFGLTAAMVAYRFAGTVIFFPTIGAEEKRLLEPQCRFMAFVATLATAVATIAESGLVVQGDDEYHPLNGDTSLYAWLSSHPNATFAWRTPATPLPVQACAAIAARFVPKGLLADFDLRVVVMMYEAITPKATMNGVESTLARVVRQSIQRVLDHYREKQAGTFQPEANQQSVSTADADKLASKMIAAANPKVLANPLETPIVPPAPASPTAAPPRPADAGHGDAELSEPGPISGPSTSPSPNSANQAGSPAGERRIGGEGGDVLAGAPKALHDWFGALKQHPNFPALAEQLVINDEGIVIPLSMLGTFGVSSALIRKMMNDAGLILGRTEDVRGVILHPGLRDRFISQ